MYQFSRETGVSPAIRRQKPAADSSGSICAVVRPMHLLLKEEQTAAYTVEIWKRFRKWGGIPTGITQNVKDLLSSREVENIFENSDFVYMLNQAGGDRQILAKQARKTMQEQQKSSVLQKLRQEPPVRKPAAPKKREPER